MINHGHQDDQETQAHLQSFEANRYLKKPMEALYLMGINEKHHIFFDKLDTMGDLAVSILNASFQHSQESGLANIVRGTTAFLTDRSLSKLVSIYVPCWGIVMTTSEICRQLSNAVETDHLRTFYSEHLPNVIAKNMGVASPVDRKRDAFLFELSAMDYDIEETDSGAAMRAMRHLGINEPTASQYRQFVATVRKEKQDPQYLGYCILKAAGLPAHITDAAVNTVAGVAGRWTDRTFGNNQAQGANNGAESTGPSLEADAPHSVPQQASRYVVRAWTPSANVVLEEPENKKLIIEKPTFTVSLSTKIVASFTVRVTFGPPVVITANLVVAPIAACLFLKDWYKSIKAQQQYERLEQHNTQMNESYREAIEQYNEKFEIVQYNDGTENIIGLKPDYNWIELIPQIIHAKLTGIPVEELMSEFNRRRSNFASVTLSARTNFNEGAIHERAATQSSHAELDKNNPDYHIRQGIHHECDGQATVAKFAYSSDPRDRVSFAKVEEVFDKNNFSQDVQKMAVWSFLLYSTFKICDQNYTDQNLEVALAKSEAYMLAQSDVDGLMLIANLRKRIPTDESAIKYNELLDRVSNIINELPDDNQYKPRFLENLGIEFMSKYFDFEQQNDGATVFHVKNPNLADLDQLESFIKRFYSTNIEANEKAFWESEEGKDIIFQEELNGFKKNLSDFHQKKLQSTADSIGAAASSLISKVVGSHGAQPSTILYYAPPPPSLEESIQLNDLKNRFYQDPGDISNLMAYVGRIAKNRLPTASQEALEAFQKVDYTKLFENNDFGRLYKAFEESVNSGLIDDKNAYVKFYSAVNNAIDISLSRINSYAKNSREKIISINSAWNFLAQIQTGMHGKVKNYIINDLTIRGKLEKLKQEFSAIQVDFPEKKELAEKINNSIKENNDDLSKTGMDGAEFVQWILNEPIQRLVDQIDDKDPIKPYFNYLLALTDGITEVLSRCFEYQVSSNNRILVVISGALTLTRSALYQWYSSCGTKRADIPDGISILINMTDGLLAMLNIANGGLVNNPLAMSRSIGAFMHGFFRMYKKSCHASGEQISESNMFVFFSSAFETLATNPALYGTVSINLFTTKFLYFLRDQLIINGRLIKDGSVYAGLATAGYWINIGLAAAAAISLSHDVVEFVTLESNMTPLFNAVTLISEAEGLFSQAENMQEKGYPVEKINEYRSTIKTNLNEAKQKIDSVKYTFSQSQMVYIQKIYAKARYFFATESTASSDRESLQQHLVAMEEILRILENDDFKRENSYFEQYYWRSQHCISKENAKENIVTLFYSFYYRYIAIKSDSDQKAADLFSKINKIIKPYYTPSDKDKELSKREQERKFSMQRTEDHMNARSIDLAVENFVNNVKCSFRDDCKPEYDALQKQINGYSFNHPGTTVADSAMHGECRSRLVFRRYSFSRFSITNSTMPGVSNITTASSENDTLWQFFLYQTSRTLQYLIGQPTTNPTDEEFKYCPAIKDKNGNVLVGYSDRAALDVRQVDYIFSDISLWLTSHFSWIPLHLWFGVLNCTNNHPALFALTLGEMRILKNLVLDYSEDKKIKNCSWVDKINGISRDNEDYKKLNFSFMEVLRLKFFLKKLNNKTLHSKISWSLRLTLDKFKFSPDHRVNAIVLPQFRAAIAAARESITNNIFRGAEVLKKLPQDRSSGLGMTGSDVRCMNRIFDSLLFISEPWIQNCSKHKKAFFQTIQFCCSFLIFCSSLYDVCIANNADHSILERAILPIIHLYFVCSQLMRLIHYCIIILQPDMTHLPPDQQSSVLFFARLLMTVKNNKLFNFFGNLVHCQRILSYLSLPKWEFSFNMFESLRSLQTTWADLFQRYGKSAAEAFCHLGYNQLSDSQYVEKFNNQSNPCGSVYNQTDPIAAVNYIRQIEWIETFQTWGDNMTQAYCLHNFNESEILSGGNNLHAHFAQCQSLSAQDVVNHIKESFAKSIRDNFPEIFSYFLVMMFFAILYFEMLTKKYNPTSAAEPLKAFIRDMMEKASQYRGANSNAPAADMSSPIPTQEFDKTELDPIHNEQKNMGSSFFNVSPDRDTARHMKFTKPF